MTKISKTAPMVAILALGTAMLFAGDALARGPDGGAVFSEMDTNGDGQITTEEFQAFKDSRMGKIDTDGDGFLSAEELAAAAKARQAEQEKVRQQRRYEMLLARADTNGDGKLSTDEFQAFMQAHARGPVRGPMMGENGFPPGWDANGDGVVSQEEFQTALAKMAKMRGPMRGPQGNRDDGRHGTW